MGDVVEGRLAASAARRKSARIVALVIRLSMRIGTL